MTDYEKLVKIRAELLVSEENSYARLKKVNALDKLIACTNEEGKLTGADIPLFEHDIEYLKSIIEILGYSPQYSEEWNYFYDTTCCNVKI